MTIKELLLEIEIFLYQLKIKDLEKKIKELEKLKEGIKNDNPKNHKPND